MADASGALAHARRRHAVLQPGEAGDALLGDGPLLVEVDALVRACLHAEPVAVAPLLVDEDDAVLLAPVDRVARTGLEAGGLRAVHADHRQVEEVRVRVFAPADVLVPVRAPCGRTAVVLAGPQVHAGVAAVEHVLVVEVPRLAPFAASGGSRPARARRRGSRRPVRERRGECPCPASCSRCSTTSRPCRRHGSTASCTRSCRSGSPGTC